MMAVGNFSLAAAVLALNFARHTGNAAHGWLDGISGFLFGLSIGISFCVARRARRCVS
jgi:hypothetical protein